MHISRLAVKREHIAASSLATMDFVSLPSLPGILKLLIVTRKYLQEIVERDSNLRRYVIVKQFFQYLQSLLHFEDSDIDEALDTEEYLLEQEVISESRAWNLMVSSRKHLKALAEMETDLRRYVLVTRFYAKLRDLNLFEDSENED